MAKNTANQKFSIQLPYLINGISASCTDRYNNANYHISYTFAINGYTQEFWVSLDLWRIFNTAGGTGKGMESNHRIGRLPHMFLLLWIKCASALIVLASPPSVLSWLFYDSSDFPFSVSLCLEWFQQLFEFCCIGFVVFFPPDKWRDIVQPDFFSQIPSFTVRELPFFNLAILNQTDGEEPFTFLSSVM